jgi:hypothetical protein
LAGCTVVRPCDGEEGIHHLRPELCAAAPANLLERVRERQRARIRPLRRHRVPRIGKTHDRRLERDLLGHEPVGVAKAVPALVMVPDRRHGVLQP